MAYKEDLISDYFSGIPFRMSKALIDSQVMRDTGLTDMDAVRAYKELDAEFPGAT